MFYAPWCGHCTRMKPYYEKAALMFKREEKFKNKPKFAKVDATVDKELGARFEIAGFPTLKIFRKGVVHKYDGPRQDEKGATLFK